MLFSTVKYCKPNLNKLLHGHGSTNFHVITLINEFEDFLISSAGKVTLEMWWVTDYKLPYLKM